MTEARCEICGLVEPHHGIGCPNEGERNTVLELMPKITKDAWLTNFKMTQDYLGSLTLPAVWVREPYPVDHPLFGMVCYQKGNKREGMRVIADCSVFWDKTRWIHVSVSRRNRMPSYDDLVEVKALFIGPDRQAIQLFPKKEKHVNIHPNCLHLWCCLDGDGLPDFGRYGTI